MGVIVPPHGPQPSPVLCVGEAPGSQEAKAGRPFVGPAGKEQQLYVSKAGMNVDEWRLANVVGLYRRGNPDPTPELIAEWTPRLLAEIERTQPRLIVSVGRFATRWFLGEEATMRLCHGIPHRAGCFDRTREDRARGAVVLPVTHPAAGLHDKTGEVKAVVRWDYAQVAHVLNYSAENPGKSLLFRRTDPWEGREAYEDVSGAVLRERLRDHPPDVLGLDTEGSSRNPHRSVPWSIQVSRSAGGGWCLRRSRSDFESGVESLQSCVDNGTKVVVHNALYDVELCRKMGLDLSRCDLLDTMYSAYLTRIEPQGLKPLAWRHCGMRMRSFESLFAGLRADEQRDYLFKVAWHTWDHPEPIVKEENDGTISVTEPQHVGKRAQSLIHSLAKDEGTDLVAGWESVYPHVRRPAEERFGPFPKPSLDDVPLYEAARYACQDADAALRLSEVL